MSRPSIRDSGGNRNEQGLSPNGARFDSPGRQPWVSNPKSRESPEGAKFWRSSRCISHFGISPRWGFTARLFANPGRRSARPGLSNLAPLGLSCAGAYSSRVCQARASPRCVSASGVGTGDTPSRCQAISCERRRTDACACSTHPTSLSDAMGSKWKIERIRKRLT
jgi:hypothetical protein